jgi:acyl-CoA synthetase (NDP forming)
VPYDRPTSGLEAKFSTPYVVASALARDRVGPAVFADDALDHGPTETGWVRVAFEADPSLPYGSHASTVRIYLADGTTHEHHEPAPPGTPETPPSEAELRRKFDACVGRALLDDRAETLYRRLDALRDRPVSDLLAPLRADRWASFNHAVGNTCPTRMARDADLTTLFAPESIALVGASADPEKLAGRPYRFLREFGYDGEIYLVNPNRKQIDGRPCHDSVRDIPGPVDVALVLVPAAAVETVVRDCGSADVPFAVVVASGFAETGDEGAARQRAVARAARESGVRLVGPNSEGFLSFSPTPVAATFSSICKRDDLLSGSVGFVSQSGAFGGAVFQLMQNLGVGARAWITTGNEADVDALDVLAHYVEDPAVDVVATYLESVSDGRRLLEAGERAAATDTRLVAMRVGASAAGERATASHTGSIATDDAVYDAVLAQAGAARVRSVDAFADAVAAFSRLPPSSEPAAGEGLGVVSISGGAAALIADAAERTDLPLATLDDDVIGAVEREIPPYGSPTNPVDVTGAAIGDPAVFERCLDAVAGDDAVGSLLLQFGNSGAEHAEVCRETMLAVRADHDLPVAAVFTGSDPRPGTVAALREANVWTFGDPVRAVETLATVHDVTARRRRLLARDRGWALSDDREPFPREDWTAATARLREAGVAVADGRLVERAADAVAAFRDLEAPVVAKLDPLASAHKTEVGGVRTELWDEAAVRAAYDDLADLGDGRVLVQETIEGVELVVGVVDDDDFGPVMLFGPGGTLVELLNDAVAYCVLPVTAADARELVADSAAPRLLDGYRGAPAADREAVIEALVAVSEAYLASDIATLEVNPLVATPTGAVAVDLIVE